MVFYHCWVTARNVYFMIDMIWYDHIYWLIEWLIDWLMIYSVSKYIIVIIDSKLIFNADYTNGLMDLLIGCNSPWYNNITSICWIWWVAMEQILVLFNVWWILLHIDGVGDVFFQELSMSVWSLGMWDVLCHVSPPVNEQWPFVVDLPIENGDFP